MAVIADNSGIFSFFVVSCRVFAAASETNFVAPAVPRAMRYFVATRPPESSNKQILFGLGHGVETSLMDWVDVDGGR